jgi:hydrogenase-4 membrane subunit HyfE
MSSALIFQIQSILIVSLLFYGAYQRRERIKHIKIMKTAIIWDLLLVAQIELNRGAINKASKALTNSFILNIHVSLAISTVLLYGIVFYTGTKLKNGNEGIRKYHKFLGLLTLTTRVLTLITSYLVVTK